MFLLGNDLLTFTFYCYKFFIISLETFVYRQDSTVEVSRKNGIPSYLEFNEKSVLMSFVSALDGYYRLSIKWTFNLCGDAITPSLERLHRLKCHGPVGYRRFYIFS